MFDIDWDVSNFGVPPMSRRSVRSTSAPDSVEIKFVKSPTEWNQWTQCTTADTCGIGTRSRNSKNILKPENVSETEKCFTICQDDPLNIYSANMPGLIEVVSDDSIISGTYKMQSSGNLIIFEKEAGPDFYQLRFTENGLEFVFKTPMQYDIMNYRFTMADSAAYLNALESNFNQIAADLSMVKFESFDNIYYKNAEVAVKLIDRSESSCSRTCGDGEKTVHRGTFVLTEQCIVETCDACSLVDFDTNCNTWAVLGLCVDPWIGNNCPVACCTDFTQIPTARVPTRFLSFFSDVAHIWPISLFINVSNVPISHPHKCV